MKRAFLLVSSILLLFPLLSAATIAVETIQERVEPGANITIKVTLLEGGSPLNEQVPVLLQDAKKSKKITQTIATNKLIPIEIPVDAPSGYWEASAIYDGKESKELFIVERQEGATFSIVGDQLVITNVGNTRYTKTVQVAIGKTTTIKEPTLDIGESIRYRLIAPDGIYTVKVTDGEESYEQEGVALTGNVIGILDERVRERNPVTGGIGPNENNVDLSYFRRNKVIYLFVLGIFGAMILLGIQRAINKHKGPQNTPQQPPQFTAGQMAQ